MCARWIITTQAIGARQLFPCWDDPSLQATFLISINHHRKYKAFSNMPIQNQDLANNKTGMQWTHFIITPKISAERVGFVVHDLRGIKYNGINIWYRKQSTLLLLKDGRTIIELTMMHLKTNWEFLETSTLDDTRIHHIVIPGLRYNLNKWNLIFYR